MEFFTKATRGPREKLSCSPPPPGGGGGGGTPLYKPYRYVRHQRVWFLNRFGLKTGIDFEHFGLKLGMFWVLFENRV